MDSHLYEERNRYEGLREIFSIWQLHLIQWLLVIDNPHTQYDEMVLEDKFPAIN